MGEEFNTRALNEAHPGDDAEHYTHSIKQHWFHGNVAHAMLETFPVNLSIGITDNVSGRLGNCENAYMHWMAQAACERSVVNFAV